MSFDFFSFVLIFQHFIIPQSSVVMALLRENAIKRLIDLIRSNEAADDGLWRAVFGMEHVAKYLYCKISHSDLNLMLSKS
jgi:hypothetical protein